MPRGALALLVRVWLVCQLCAALGVPLIAWTSTHRAGAAECECKGGSGGICPMHKTQKDRSGCAFRSATPDVAPTLLSFFGPIGLAPSSAGVHLIQVGSSFQLSLSPVIDGSVDPDPPPPRA
jgi:hypothetical protein